MPSSNKLHGQITTESLDTERAPGAARTRSMEEKLQVATTATTRPLLARLWLYATSPTPELEEPPPPPDGGFRAWAVVFMTHMAGFSSYGFLNAYGVLQAYYMSTLHLPQFTVSLIGSLQAFCLFFTSAFSGRATDAGYFHQALFLGTVLFVTGMLTMASATKYWQLLLSQGLVVGVGGGLVFCPLLSLVGTYFLHRRALAMSICAVGNSLGGLVFAALLQNLIPAVGFAWAIRTCAFLAAASLVPANWISKPRGVKRSVSQGIIDWGAFREPTYACFAAGMFFCMMAIFVPTFYLGSFGRDALEISNKKAASLLLLINGFGALGRVTISLEAFRFGPMNTMILLNMISGVILFSWAGVGTYAQVIVFDIFYGFINSGAQGMLAPSLGCLISDLSKMGVRIGMVFAICGLAVFVGNPLAGALITLNGGKYIYAQIFAGASMISGVLLLSVARVLKTGWVLGVKI